MNQFVCSIQSFLNHRIKKRLSCSHIFSVVESQDCMRFGLLLRLHSFYGSIAFWKALTFEYNVLQSLLSCLAFRQSSHTLPQSSWYTPLAIASLLWCWLLLCWSCYSSGWNICFIPFFLRNWSNLKLINLPQRAKQ